MSTFRHNWYLCGGWAVDSWLGCQTRDHLDIDITVFEDDQRAIFEHLADWALVAHDPNTAGDAREPWDGRRLELPAHIHAAQSVEILHAWVPSGMAQRDAFNLEVILNERDGQDWLLSGEPRIALPLDRCARQSPWGLPTAAPDVLLFYKATAYFAVEGMKERPHDEADFLALLPELTGRQRQWLGEAIRLVHPRHPWLAPLPG
ncbi:MAG: hypothetical protein HYX53_10765 [Chloroflexi bacterium]|nr:hypothetical protein [Chloroflexota bacterium]